MGLQVTDVIANIIRFCDGDHEMGAGAIAEAIVTELEARGYCLVLMAPDELEAL